jgi:hypothetical protein
MKLFKIVALTIILDGLFCTAGCMSNSLNRSVEDSIDVHVVIGPDYRNQGKVSYAIAPHSKVIIVEDSSHCHLEFPGDGKCSFVCGKGEMRFSREVIQQTIPGLTTAFILWQTSLDPYGQTRWSESEENYKILIDAGYIKNQ